MFVFRIVLAALMLSTSVGIWYAVANRPAFQLAFPGTANPAVYAGLLAVGATGLLALAGLWRWRRWAVALYGILAVAGIVLDVLADAPALHQITLIAGAVVVFTLVYLNRRRFHPESSRAPSNSRMDRRARTFSRKPND